MLLNSKCAKAMREMGCNKSKNNVGVELGNRKSSNKDKDKGVQQSNILSNAMKTGAAKEKITKRVRFEEAIPDNEKLIAMNMNKKVAESEDEAYFSAEDDIGLKKENAPKSKHAHKN